MKIRRIKILLLFLSVMIGGLILGLENGLSQQSPGNKKILSLKMYVPSPVAIYQKLSTSILQLKPLDLAGAGNCQGYPDLEGSLYFNQADKQIYICDSDQGWIAGTDIWEKDGTNQSIYPLDIAEDNSDYKIGIGTTTPEFQLSLEGDGSLIAVGHPTTEPGDPPEIPILTSGRELSTEGEGAKLIWWPKMGAFRAGYVENDQWNAGKIGRYSVAMGLDTIATGTASIVAGGFQNEVYDDVWEDVSYFDFLHVSVSGGYKNSVPYNGVWVTLSGGSINKVHGDASTLSGGSRNHIGDEVEDPNASPPAFSNISGGFANKIWCHTSCGGNTISGGGANNLLSLDSGESHLNVISGGGENSIDSGSYIWYIKHNTIAGGGSNVINPYPDEGSPDHSIIGGGDQNVIKSDFSTILGGYRNEIGDEPDGHYDYAPNFCSILGGERNEAIGSDWQETDSDDVVVTTILGGRVNLAGALSVVLGGKDNLAWDKHQSTIHGGYSNRHFETISSTILGGWDNEISEENRRDSRYYAVVGGYKVEHGKGFVWSTNGFDGDQSSYLESNDFSIDASKVGIGITNPTATLHVDGNIKADLQRLSGGSSLKYNQSTQEIGYDVAELFETTEKVEKGDVLVLDEKEKFKLKRATGAYDKKVIGIVSSSPAILFKGSQLEIAPSPGGFLKGTKPPVALSGRVFCKVTNENGPIEAGDFLTTSSRPGYAMKATDKEKFFGTVLGKALEPLGRGKTGLILVLVTLQ